MKAIILSVFFFACLVRGASDGEGSVVIWDGGNLYEGKLLKAGVRSPARDASGILATVSLSDLPAEEAIRYVCAAAYMRYELTPTGVVITPRDTGGWPGRHQVFRMKPAFDGIVGDQATTEDVKRYLESIGIEFSPMHRLYYHREKRLLLVRFCDSETAAIERLFKELDVLDSVAFRDPPPLTARDVPWGDKLKIVIPRLEVEEGPVSRVFMMIAEMTRKQDPDGIGVNIAVQTSGTRAVVVAKEGVVGRKQRWVDLGLVDLDASESDLGYWGFDPLDSPRVTAPESESKDKETAPPAEEAPAAPAAGK